MRKLSLVILSIMLIIPAVVFGQSDADQTIKVDIDPAYPRPKEMATLSVSSFMTNLDKSQINWYVNGVAELQGIGEKEFNFRMGDVGENKTVRVVINKPDGSNFSKTYNFNPTEVNLLYEADTYTPPFYKGKAWFTSQSAVKIVAQPRMILGGRLLDNEEYIYTWKIDGDVVSSQSGYGQNIFFYESPIISKEVVVTVEVSPLNGNNTAKSSVRLTPRNPIIMSYEKNPIYGTILERAVYGEHYLNRDEITFELIPFFFSDNNPFANLSFNWFMNDREIETPDSPNEITLRIEDEDRGKSEIRAEVNHTSRIQQNNEINFTLFFEKNNQGFSF